MRHSNGAVFTLSSAMPAKSGTIAFRYQTVTIYSDISIRTGSGIGRFSLRYRIPGWPDAGLFAIPAFKKNTTYKGKTCFLAMDIKKLYVNARMPEKRDPYFYP
jgi:hypothetical protein